MAVKIVYMGTPDFAVPALRALAENGYEIGYAVTQPDRRGNRGKVTFSPVKEAALEIGAEVLQPARLRDDEETKQKLADYAPDLFIVAAYGQILKKDVLDIPRLGCFNIHGSLLPKLRGASPIQQAILQGDEKAGVTIMKMGVGLDDGDMVSKAETPIDHKTYGGLSDELARLGADLLIRTLPSILDGTAVFTPQDDAEATKVGLISKKDGEIDFTEDPAICERKIRAFDPWPGTYFVSGKNKVKIWKADLPGGSSDAAPGTVLRADKKGIEVACGGGVLRILELQMPGKKRMEADAFLRGHKLKKGDSLLG